MYCKKCGAENSDGSRFCKNCGCKLTNNSKMVSSSMSLNKIAACILFLIVIAGAFHLYKGTNQNNKNAKQTIKNSTAASKTVLPQNNKNTQAATDGQNPTTSSTSKNTELSPDLNQYLMSQQELQQNLQNYKNSSKQNTNNTQTPASAETGKSSAYYASLVNQYTVKISNDESAIAAAKQQLNETIKGNAPDFAGTGKSTGGGGSITLAQQKVNSLIDQEYNDKILLNKYQELEDEARNQGR